ncbi:cardioacceleratory peptide receptor-like [Ruditapes philippinarum]|uniref:cardioacceleratory peptide receptor-like n=1 Tax=Ruditapes philippinarum TaxID=129788 RepID=UPI00295BCDCF|nr:cardioacceleratory peptide receptor-like [Ruditapes philippinarum]
MSGNRSNGTYVGNSTNNPYEFYQAEQLIFLCILFAMIVIGNTLVLLAIISSGKRRSRMNFFMINLACADLSVGCLMVLTDIIWKATITWHAGNIGCKVVKFAQCAATYGATYSLVALSIDRFDAIARPMSMAGVEKRCRILVTLAWMFAGLFSVPMFFMYEEQMIDNIPQCWMDLKDPWMWQLYMTLVSFAVFIIPAIIIASCYIIIVVIIWSKSSMKFKSPPENGCSEKTRCLSENGSITVRFTASSKTKTQCMSASSSRGLIPKAKIKTIKMTFVIVLAFILCWSPYFIWDLLTVYGHITMSQDVIAVSTFIQSLAPLNSAANPLIYTLFNTAMCTRIFKKQTNYNSPPTSHGFAGNF